MRGDKLLLSEMGDKFKIRTVLYVQWLKCQDYMQAKE